MLNHYLTTLKPKQLSAATHTQGPLLLIAGAGTGKTTTITDDDGYTITDAGRIAVI